jgi:hypothetical protein
VSDITVPETDDESPHLPEVRAALRREQDRRKELETLVERERQGRVEAEKARAVDAVRIGDLTAQVTFLRAGVDTDLPAGRRFFENYDGALDPDSVQAAYAAYLRDANAAAARFADHLHRNGGSHA